MRGVQNFVNDRPFGCVETCWAFCRCRFLISSRSLPCVLSDSWLWASLSCSESSMTFFSRSCNGTDTLGSEVTRQDWAAWADCLISTRSLLIESSMPSRYTWFSSYTKKHNPYDHYISTTTTTKNVCIWYYFSTSDLIPADSTQSSSPAVFPTRFLRISNLRSHRSSINSLSLDMRSLKKDGPGHQIHQEL